MNSKSLYLLLFISTISLASCIKAINEGNFNLDYLPVKKNNLWGYINKKGDWLIEPQFEEAYLFTIDGIAKVRKKNYSYYYINKNGKVCAGGDYGFYNASHFVNGKANVYHTSGNSSCIDKNGNTLFELKDIWSCSEFNNGRALIKKNNRFGFIDEKGIVVIDPIYEQATAFNEGLAAVLVKVNGKKLWGFINPDESWAIEPKFYKVGRFQDGLCYAVNSSKTDNGYIDNKGTFVIKFSNFNKLKVPDSHEFFEGMAPFISMKTKVKDDYVIFQNVERSFFYGAIDKSGNIKVKPEFELVGNFSGGMAAIRLNGKFGYVDKNGLILLQPQYEGATRFFMNGLAAIKINGEYGFIDKAGKLIIQPQYDDVYKGEDILDFISDENYQSPVEQLNR